MRRNTGDRWRSRRTFALAVSLGLAVLTGGPLGASAAQLGARPSTLIVPGESIGPARLGMTVAEGAPAPRPPAHVLRVLSRCVYFPQHSGSGQTYPHKVIFIANYFR